MKFNTLDNVSGAAVQFSTTFGFKPQLNFVEQIQQHPFYPSLLSISEVLETEAGIKNFAVKLKPEQLKEVHFPCLAHLNSNGGEYALLKAVTDEMVIYELNAKKKKLALADFVKIWSGVVLLTDSEKITLQRKIEFQEFAPYLLPALGIVLLALLFVNSLQNSIFHPFNFTAQFIIIVIGLAVSVLLLLQSLGKINTLIQQICGGDTKHNCNSILSAKAANVTTWLSLSDLGFLYFSGGLMLLFLSENKTAISLVILFNVLALPFTFWSVYYQWQIAKTWCRLCLMIQGLFWLQAIFSFYSFSQQPFFFGFNLSPLPFLLLIYVFPLVVWMSVKPLVKNLQEIKPLKQELNKFKFNLEAFDQLLKNQKQYIGSLPKTTLVLGNPDSALTITMVSNPFCNPCAKAHQFLEEWIAKEIDFRLNIVYTFSMNENDRQQQFFKHLLAIQKTDIHLVEKALKDWYSLDYQKLDSWKEKYPTKTDEEDKLELLEQVNWCKMNEIKGTPTFYINGYQLPDSYRLKDLKYILMNLAN